MGERGITVEHMMECNLERFHLLGVLHSLTNCSWVIEVASLLQQEHVGESPRNYLGYCVRLTHCLIHRIKKTR